MKKSVKKIIYTLKFGYKADSETYIKYLKKKGVNIGKNVNFYSPHTIRIDITTPYMIKIGNNVHITAGVTILNHGYDWIVANEKYGNVFGCVGTVKIGNNVFIGNNAPILKGAEIGDNVIIGANSLVNNKCLKEGVYAGVPAKYIMSLDEYIKKRISAQDEEAKNIVYEYYNKYKKIPDKKILRAYFWLFELRNDTIDPFFDDINHRNDK